MIQSQKFLIRRHLDAYSEIEVAKLLREEGWTPYFPFKDDEGIDMLVKKGEKIRLYQLKARNPQPEKKKSLEYWFPSKKNVTQYKNKKKFSKSDRKKISFIFCAWQSRLKEFHFFRVPLKEVEKYFAKKTKSGQFFEIIQQEDDAYRLGPRENRKTGVEINDHININKYRWPKTSPKREKKSKRKIAGL